mmetsp:Transcript_74572/g.215483  ORF Transcript_74572/g.215483 Transcript_74572/m.215483 type:complete len:225 (-) Transcript_74572:1107-1781(-)
MDGIDELPGVLQAAAVAGAIGAADPARVHQVGVGAVLVELRGEHLRVDVGVPHQERRAETSGEGGFRLLHALLGARDLGRVPGDEVVHHLLLRQLGDRRQDPEGVAGKEDDLLRLVLDLRRDPCIRDEAQGVGYPRVLRDRNVVKVHLPGALVEDDVLQHGAEADGVEDLGLFLAGQADGLGVAAALDVEDALRVPHVLVVADELALRVRAKCRLARAAEAEED